MKFRALNHLSIPINLVWQWNGIERVAALPSGAIINIEQPVVAKSDNDDKKNLVFTAFEAATNNVALVNGERQLIVPVNDIKDEWMDEPLQLSIKPSNNLSYNFSSYKAFIIHFFADRKIYLSVARCCRRYCDLKMLGFFLFFLYSSSK